MSNKCNVDFEEITKFPESNIKIILFLTACKYQVKNILDRAN